MVIIYVSHKMHRCPLPLDRDLTVDNLKDWASYPTIAAAKEELEIERLSQVIEEGYRFTFVSFSPFKPKQNKTILRKKK